MILIIICSAVFCFGILWFKTTWKNRPLDKFATLFKGPSLYQIIRTLLYLLGTRQQISGKVFNILADYVPEPMTLWLGPFFNVMISKPEDLQIVLNNSKALKKNWCYKLTAMMLGDGLLTAPVEKWKKHRRIINPAFSTEKINEYFSIFIEHNDVFIRNLGKEDGNTLPFDIFNYVLTLNIDTICQNAMGCNHNCQLNDISKFKSGFMIALEMFVERLFKPWLYPEFVFSTYLKLKGVYEYLEIMQKIPLQVIKRKKQILAQRTSSNVFRDINEKNNPKVFLDTLLELNAAGADFSDDGLRDEVLTMVLAGSETMAITISFTILMLAIHKEIQAKVYDEICDVVGAGGDGPILIEDINKFEYLEQVIMETQRLYPSIPVTARQLDSDIKIFSGDCILPKKTNVIINIYGTHRSPEIYTNPTVFNPDNFSKEMIAKRHKYSFIPFSGGARGCIGMKYAMMSMKISIIKFLQNFNVHTHISFDDISLEFSALLKKSNGYPVLISSRDKKCNFS